ncbi:DNA-binding transcriptional regulator, CsgD family [Rhizobium hainanense]|uniref:DNA-binding transcriptional regulator, CsgD family n=1 Tax=Rhizobium hainanense TaxID=52131 RepID=A0A1C3WCK2_9HYPH|nr:DNA-binding transcriptional regulator, CsgD family [Rhizobium hainanense]
MDLTGMGTKRLGLSPLVRASLLWCAQGRTISEIAVIQDRTATQIQSDIEQALRELNVNSMEEAVEQLRVSGPL